MILFLKGCPSPSITLTTLSPPPLRRRRLPCPSVTALPRGDCPYDRLRSTGGTSTGHAPLWTSRGRVLPLLAIALTGRHCHYWRHPLHATGRLCLPPLSGAAGLPCGLTVDSRPSSSCLQHLLQKRSKNT
ncbi:hypothetical protein GW17_00047070 [Ensete ventricosum]|nr:hypothetical protein GW17_00047070 [Ensete ventricosum]